MFDFYPAYEEHFAQVQLSLFMLGMGATLYVGDFVKVLLRPRSFVVALIGQIVFSPLIALAVISLFGLTGGIAVGLILTAAMPGGATAKAFVILGRGSVPLAISLTAASTLATIVTVPLTLQLCAREYISDSFDMPTAAIVRDVACFVFVPLTLGMCLGTLSPRRRQALSRWSIRVGALVILAMIICALGSQRIRPGARGLTVPIAIVVFGLFCQQSNMAPFRLLGWPRPDKVSAGIEITMRNMNLALLLKASLFPESGTSDGAAIGAEVMFVVLFYAGAAFFLGLPMALRYRRIARRERDAATM